MKIYIEKMDTDIDRYANISTTPFEQPDEWYIDRSEHDVYDMLDIVYLIQDYQLDNDPNSIEGLEEILLELALELLTTK